MFKHTLNSCLGICIYSVWKFIDTPYWLRSIRRIGGFLEHRYAVSSLMDTAYRLSEQYLEISSFKLQNAVYQMDIKSVFLNEKIYEEVCVHQPSRFESSEFPNHVCKLDKAMYGLKQAPRAWYQANPKESHLIDVDDKLQFVEEPVEIMEREIKRLKRSRIPLVKVRWNSRRGPEFTWEREDSFKQKYPQLFTNRASSSTTRS
ncbi:putative reverse transcriptase domain-containing protein [Tanacetum coccineum]|uniref:Reverse transcriptase domain-containing protein n=1 Tax=Tanacetum coccineum TaxID=301880 RepID=A0ABQ5AD66_9ASTR